MCGVNMCDAKANESKVWNTDCLNLMRQRPDGYYDLTIADPPYFSGPEKRGYYGSRRSAIGVHRDYPITATWETPTNEVFAEIRRVSKRIIIWGCNYFPTAQLPVGRIVWDKWNSSSSFSDCEIAATDEHDSVRIFRYMWNGMMQGKSISEGCIMQGNKAMNEKRIHPTQKPVLLYKWLLMQYAKPGMRIFDPYLGSGSSRIAAYDMGMDFEGCEIEKGYFDLQNKRFEEHTAQMRMEIP